MLVPDNVISRHIDDIVYSIHARCIVNLHLFTAYPITCKFCNLISFSGSDLYRSRNGSMKKSSYRARVNPSEITLKTFC